MWHRHAGWSCLRSPDACHLRRSLAVYVRGVPCLFALDSHGQSNRRPTQTLAQKVLPLLGGRMACMSLHLAGAVKPSNTWLQNLPVAFRLGGLPAVVYPKAPQQTNGMLECRSCALQVMLSLWRHRPPTRPRLRRLRHEICGGAG